MLAVLCIAAHIAAASPPPAAAAASPPAAEPADHTVTGELVRIHLPRRAFMLRTGKPARELEIRVDDASELWVEGRRVPLLDLHPGDQATVRCSDRAGAHHARAARFTASSAR